MGLRCQLTSANKRWQRPLSLGWRSFSRRVSGISEKSCPSLLTSLSSFSLKFLHVWCVPKHKKCVGCVYTHVWVWVHACHRVLVLAFCFVWEGRLLLTAADMISGQVAFELLEILISPQKCWDCGCMVFMDSGDFGIGPHRSMASALPTEPSSQPPLMFCRWKLRPVRI